MISVPFVDLAAQHAMIQESLDSAFRRVVSKSAFTLGKEVEEFEAAFARFVGATHAIGVSCGLDALRLSLLALDIGPGDEIILPANTFIATALAVTAVGAQPVLVDCDPGTYNLDTRGLEAAVTPRTRAIIPVHLAGQAADMDAVLSIASLHGLSVVEDAAQAHGTYYRRKACGTLGRLGCFSFYPSKNLGALGDGGMVTTSEAALADRLARLRNYGQVRKYYHAEKGLNARLDAVQAAFLAVKLPHLAGWNRLRARHAVTYRERLMGVGDIRFPRLQAHSTHIFHLFMVETDRRDALQAQLSAAGVQTGIHYPVPIHLQEAYADLGYRRGQFPIAEHLAERVLSLPMYPELSEEQIDHVVGTVRSFFAGG